MPGSELCPWRWTLLRGPAPGAAGRGVCCEGNGQRKDTEQRGVGLPFWVTGELGRRHASTRNTRVWEALTDFPSLPGSPGGRTRGHMGTVSQATARGKRRGSPAGVAPLVGASSHAQKGCGFESQSGHTPRFQVQFRVRTCAEGSQPMSLSRGSIAPPPFSSL